jgi:signal transduction histidine kinase
MNKKWQELRETLLLPATSSKALDWQVIALTAFFSTVVHIFASQDLEFQFLFERVIAAALSVIPMFFVIWLSHMIPVRSSNNRIWLILCSYVVGGAVRGISLSMLLNLTGVLSGGDWQARILSSALSMSVTVAIVAYVWVTFKTRSDAIANLINETAQLRTALARIDLEANAQSIQYVADITSQIVYELERIQLSPGDKQVDAIQRIIDEQVRPLSKEFAVEVASWAPPNASIPSAKFIATWKSLDPISSLPSPWFAGAISLAPLPLAYANFGPTEALGLSLFIFIALVPSMLLGFSFARRIVPKFESPWREVAFTIIMELIAIPPVLATYIALIDTDNPSAYLIAGLITFPIYAWILAIGGALFEDLKRKLVALLEVEAQLKWAIARVNLLAWYHRGVISRLLHGPVQNAMHATVIRLRNRDTLTVVDNVIEELQQRISSANSSLRFGPRDTKGLEISLGEIRILWNQIADVSIAHSNNFIEVLQLDKPAAAIVVDLCNELCSNAIRHGKATELRIKLEFDGTQITVRVTDNGTIPAEVNGLGLGSNFLDSCSISWTSFRFADQNVLNVLLPSAAA